MTLDIKSIIEHPRVISLLERLKAFGNVEHFGKLSFDNLPEGSIIQQRLEVIRRMERKMCDYLDDISYALPRSAEFAYHAYREDFNPDTFFKRVCFQTLENQWIWEIAEETPPQMNLNIDTLLEGTHDIVLKFLRKNYSGEPKPVTFRVKTFREIYDLRYQSLGAQVIGRESNVVIKPSAFVPSIIVHEMMHCNSYGFPAFILDEGMTELMTGDFVADKLGLKRLEDLNGLDDVRKFYANARQTRNPTSHEYFGYARLTFALCKALGTQGMINTYRSGKLSFDSPEKNKFWDDLTWYALNKKIRLSRIEVFPSVLLYACDELDKRGIENTMLRELKPVICRE